jgi:hypothetical protein
MRLDAEASLGLTAGAIGIFACSILVTVAADIDAGGDSTDQQPLSRWQAGFVCAMSLSASLCVFTAALCGAVYREGMQILSADETQLFHRWWKKPAVRRGRTASRLAHGTAVPAFIVGLSLHIHDRLSGESMALSVAVASMFGVAWVTATGMSATVEGYHGQRSAHA